MTTNPLRPSIEALTASQERALRIIEARPGITIVEAAKLLACSHATATYHLSLLVRRGYAASRRDGREVRHFVAGAAADPVSWLQVVCRDTRRLALVLLLAQPGMQMTMNDMSRRLNVPFGSLKRTLLQFQAQGLVTMERRGFRYVLRANPPLLAFAATVRPAPALEEVLPAQPAGPAEPVLSEAPQPPADAVVLRI